MNGEIVQLEANIAEHARPGKPGRAEKRKLLWMAGGDELTAEAGAVLAKPPEYQLAGEGSEAGKVQYAPGPFEFEKIRNVCAGGGVRTDMAQRRAGLQDAEIPIEQNVERKQEGDLRFRQLERERRITR